MITKTVTMPSLAHFLGNSLIKADGTTVDTEDLMKEDQIVGLFFSASWCPPCQSFTCKLLEFYTKFKESSPEKKLEVVLIGSDRDESGFMEYFRQMPWLALPFADRDKKVILQCFLVAQVRIAHFFYFAKF